MKTTFTQNWTRRRLLQATALSAGLASPLIPVRAVPPLPRNRVIFVYTPMGAPNELWQPDDCGGAIILRRASAPLEPVKHHCVFLRNLFVSDAGHGVSEKVLGGGFSAGRETTLDIRLGEAFSENVRMPNLHLGTHLAEGVVSKKNLTPATFSPSSALMYDALFNQGDDATANTPLDQKFRAELASFTPADFDKEVDLQIELSALALSRNVTNVITLMWGDHQGSFRLPAFYTGHPSVDFHQAVAGFSSNELFGIFRAYLSAKLAYLIQLLDVMRDEYHHSLLETTLVVHVTDNGNGRDHTGDNAPYLIAGGKNLFRNNAVLDVQRATQHDLMDTIAAAYGLEGVKYGTEIIRGLTRA